MLTGEQDYTSRANAEAVGFSLPPHPPALKDYLATLAPDAKEEFLQKLIQQTALHNVYELNTQLAFEGIKPETALKTKLEILDANIKLSGITAKQNAREALGGGVSIVIHMPGKDRTPITVEGMAERIEDSPTDGE